MMYASPLFHIVNKAFNISNSKKCLTIFYRKILLILRFYNLGVSVLFDKYGHSEPKFVL